MVWRLPGALLACSLIARKHSSALPTRQLVDKVRDIVGLYLDPPARDSCCVLTRRARCWAESSRFYGGCPDACATFTWPWAMTTHARRQGVKPGLLAIRVFMFIYADIGFLDQPGRTLVRNTEKEVNPAWCPSSDLPTRTSYQLLP